MAAKKRPPRAAKATQTKKKKAPTKKAAPARKVAVTGQTLRLAAKQGDVQVRRAGEAYVEKATELEAARIKRVEAEPGAGGVLRRQGCAREASVLQLLGARGFLVRLHLRVCDHRLASGAL